MEMEVAMESLAVDFSFHGGAPAMPPEINVGGEEIVLNSGELNFVEKFFSGTASLDGAPVVAQEIIDGNGEFEFEFSGQFEKAHLSTADDLFYGGKIKPLVEPPPAIIFSLRDSIKRRIERKKHVKELSREREKGNCSVTPLRVSDILVDDKPETSQPSENPKSNRSKLFSSKSFSFPSSYKKWKLKDLFLFRSFSERRSPKYSVLNKEGQDLNEKSSSFWWTEKGVVVEEQRRKSSAAAQMRWKTALPYKHGLLVGCFGGHP